MTWDPSGLQLVTCGALGHKILVHRAMPLGPPGGAVAGGIGEVV